VAIVIASFLACIAAFAVIGLLSARHHEQTPEDYLVAGRNVPAWLTALSAVATNNSGFMFVGLLGFAYRFGVQAIWLQAGWVLGDLVAWIFIHRRVREVSGELKVNSVPALIATDRNGEVSRSIVVIAGILTFFLLGGYAAAQLNAGSTTLHVLFGWDLAIGTILGTVIVVLYCFAGGLRASIWTDAAQAFVMLFSMTALIAFAMAEVGGPVALFHDLKAADPALVDWIPDGLAFGIGLFFLGWIAGGFGAVGQPHILIRSMAIESASRIPRARVVYFAWFVPFSVAAVAAGLYGRVLLPELLAGVDPSQAGVVAELTLPRLAVLLLPQIFIGMLLAGVFAATMSTADSQILSCSAAVTQDVVPRWNASYLASKIATLSVASLALVIALTADENVFALVLGAWSMLGATLGPLLILRVTGRPLPGWLGVSMMIAGLITVQLWSRSSYAGAIYDILPGMAAAFTVYLIGLPFAIRAEARA
jgi:sodium/proline symporter